MIKIDEVLRGGTWHAVTSSIEPPPFAQRAEIRIPRKFKDDDLHDYVLQVLACIYPHTITILWSRGNDVESLWIYKKSNGHPARYADWNLSKVAYHFVHHYLREVVQKDYDYELMTDDEIDAKLEAMKEAQI